MCARASVIRLLKASIEQVAQPPRAVVRASDDPNHVVHLFQRELELDAAQLLTDSASTRLSLYGKQSWCEDKLRHVGTAFHYVRGLVRNGNIDVLAVNGKDNCSDTLTKGYEQSPSCIKEFNRLARICHGYRFDTPRRVRVTSPSVKVVSSGNRLTPLCNCDMWVSTSLCATNLHICPML